jgi:hypothetical protein
VTANVAVPIARRPRHLTVKPGMVTVEVFRNIGCLDDNGPIPGRGFQARDPLVLIYEGHARFSDKIGGCKRAERVAAACGPRPILGLNGQGLTTLNDLWRKNKLPPISAGDVIRLDGEAYTVFGDRPRPQCLRIRAREMRILAEKGAG